MITQDEGTAMKFLSWPPALALCMLLVAPTAWCDEEHGDLPASHSITPQLFVTGFEFAEGPAFDRDGNLYVVNYRGNGKIGRITPEGAASVFCDLAVASPVEGRKPRANGLKVDSEGRLVVADSGAGRLLRISKDTAEVELLADRCGGVRFKSLNDVALDLAGSIYFTDPGGSTRENPIGVVYRYNIDTKKVTQLDVNLAFPNGLAVTPNQSNLCVGESQMYRVLIYDLNEDGTVANRRVLIQFPSETEGDIKGGAFEPDGMIFDQEGRLYVAMWNGAVINVVDVSTGRLLRQFDAGGNQATNCHFRGPYLYTTIASKEAVFRLKLGVTGFEYNGPP